MEEANDEKTEREELEIEWNPKYEFGLDKNATCAFPCITPEGEELRTKSLTLLCAMMTIICLCVISMCAWKYFFGNISVVEIFFTKKRNRILAETDVPPSYSVVYKTRPSLTLEEHLFPPPTYKTARRLSLASNCTEQHVPDITGDDDDDGDIFYNDPPPPFQGPGVGEVYEVIEEEEEDRSEINSVKNEPESECDLEVKNLTKDKMVDKCKQIQSESTEFVLSPTSLSHIVVLFKPQD